MPREVFDKELQHLQEEVLVMGSMVENALVESIRMLKRRDREGSRRLIVEDRLINKKRYEIENEAMKLIATQQPVARDMRTLAAILEIVTELERIGDYAKGIAKINIKLDAEDDALPTIDLPLMAEKARHMLHRALDAFVRQDVELAMAIPADDDEIDDLYNQINRVLLTFVMSDPTTIDQANFLLWAAHNLERTGDRVINLCERVVFTVKGEIVELDIEDGLLQID